MKACTSPGFESLQSKGVQEDYIWSLPLNTTQHCSPWGSHCSLKAHLDAGEFQGLTKVVCPTRLGLCRELPSDPPPNSMNTVSSRWHVPTIGPGKPAVVTVILTRNHNPSQYHKPTLCQRTVSSGPLDNMTCYMPTCQMGRLRLQNRKWLARVI